MRQVKYYFVDRLGLTAIGVVSLGYIMFWSSFAKLRIELPFLDFPIFIGEILLAICLALLVWKWVHQQWSPGRWGWVAAAYIFFFLIKTFTGYAHWGPLALRDAAFFYYPVFIIFGYAFFDPNSQGRLSRRIVLGVLLMVMALGQFTSFAGFSLLTMALLLALFEERMAVRVLLAVTVLLFAPYAKIIVFFQRTVFVSFIVSFVFLIIMTLLCFRWGWLTKIFLIILGGALILLLLSMAHRRGVWKTMSPVAILHEAKPAVAPLSDTRPRGRVLFNINGCDEFHPDIFKEFLERFRGTPQAEIEKHPQQVTSQVTVEVLQFPVEADPATVEIGTKKGNALFRYYIWKDMVKEYYQRRPLFGFAFGRPLRSPTMTFYRIASPQSEDGWIGAHNSFLYMLYRGGIIGLSMVIAILVFWGSMVRDFVGLKNMAGVFLCAALLSWMVCACFFLIFELPYTAIPVWTLWGITAKYRDFLKEQRS